MLSIVLIISVTKMKNLELEIRPGSLAAQSYCFSFFAYLKEFLRVSVFYCFLRFEETRQSFYTAPQ